MDFITDSIVTRRRFYALANIDQDSLECPAIEVDASLGERKLVSVLERLAGTRGLHDVITMDNVPDFSRKAPISAYQKGIKHSFYRPGKPIEIVFAENFNGGLSVEYLNTN